MVRQSAGAAKQAMKKAYAFSSSQPERVVLRQGSGKLAARRQPPEAQYSFTDAQLGLDGIQPESANIVGGRESSLLVEASSDKRTPDYRPFDSSAEHLRRPGQNRAESPSSYGPTVSESI
jgi:hypothetical protein